MGPTRRFLMTGPVALGAAGCSPLQVFDAVNPADPGVRRVASAAYGEGPRRGLDVYAPDDAGGSLPVAVFFYGGSWDTGSRADYAFVGEALAARGFVSVVPDYRLYPEVRYPDFLADGAAAVRWVRHTIGRHGGDPGRLCLVGHSAGAYNAAMLALAPGFLRAAGVDVRIVRAFAGLSGPYDFYPFDDPVAVREFGAAPDGPATQPVNHVRPGVAAFLATGDRDTTVRPANTAALAARLRAVGAPVVERVYPGLDHAGTLLALSRLFRGKAPVLADMTAFLRERTGPGRATPRGSAGRA